MCYNIFVNRTTKGSFFMDNMPYDKTLSGLSAVLNEPRPKLDEINEFHNNDPDPKYYNYENIDPVSGFYNKKYGRIAAIRMGTSDDRKLVFSSVICIVNYNDLLRKYGQMFCDTAIEEVSVVMRNAFSQNSVIYRNSAGEFTIVSLVDSRENAESLIRSVIAGIENIYSGSEVAIRCAAGANIRTNNEPFEILKVKTHLAASAAAEHKDKYGGFVFYDQAEKDGYVFSGMTLPSQDNEQINVKHGLTDNMEMVSFTFKIFEKSGSFDAAVNAFMSRAGRVLRMERILIFDINRSYYTLNIAYQWHAAEFAPVGTTKFTLGKAKFDVVERRMRMNDLLPTDRAAYEKYAQSENNGGKGSAYSFQMFEGDNLVGCVVYEMIDPFTDDETLNILNRCTGIISAHFSRFKADRERRAKSEFLSRMSHEIRTPMNVIIGMTKIALDSQGLSPETENCLKKIDMASHYLLELINDVLDMSRIESGKMTVEKAYIDLEELINGVDTMIRVQTDSKGISLNCEKNIPERFVLGDPLKLNQILINIMGNAVKFTENGGITLSVTESGISDKGMVNVSFSIKDTGIGISEENIDKIFNSFEQADEGIVRRYGGTGLGLSISKSLVELLGGRLFVRSEVGKGSEFYFTIPMQAVAEEESSEDPSGIQDLSGVRLLVAEDDELNREIIRTLLAKKNISAELAENGLEAVEMFERSEKGYYDAILMDIRMPVMDGLASTGKIRSLDREDAATVPILAMTANAYSDDIKSSSEYGMNGYLTKPVDMKKVMEELRRVIRNRKGSSGK